MASDGRGKFRVARCDDLQASKRPREKSGLATPRRAALNAAAFEERPEGGLRFARKILSREICHSPKRVSGVGGGCWFRSMAWLQARASGHLQAMQTVQARRARAEQRRSGSGMTRYAASFHFSAPLIQLFLTSQSCHFG